MKTIARVDFDPHFAYQSPAMPTGVTAEEVRALVPKLSRYRGELNRLFEDLPALRKSQQAWFKIHVLPEIDLKKIDAAAQDLRKNFKDVVVLGIGGSDFGPRALFDIFLDAENYNFLNPQTRGYDGKPAPDLHFFQSFDSRKCRAFLKRPGLDFTQTAFIVISKSGKTLETQRNFEFFRKKLKEALAKKKAAPGAHLQHFVLITDPALDNKGKPKSLLLQEFWDAAKKRPTARAVFPVPDGVGGRYSVFSPVGLLPAAVGGINIAALMEGVRDGFEVTQLPVDHPHNFPLLLASLQFLALQQGRIVHYFFAFGEVFKNLTKWYEQLVEESLGKRLTRKDGSKAAVRMVTKPTVGTIDNHSFVQNLLGGDPADKFVIFLAARDYARTDDISGDDAVHFDDNLLATFEGTRAAVCEESIPNVSWILPILSEKDVAQLMYFLEVSVAYLGEALLELEGATFLQPDVEKYKVKTLEALKKLK